MERFTMKKAISLILLLAMLLSLGCIAASAEDECALEITFVFADGQQETRSYTAQDEGTPFPTDEKEGCTFLGWRLAGGIHTSLERILLTTLDGQSLTAVSVFTEPDVPAPEEPEVPSGGSVSVSKKYTIVCSKSVSADCAEANAGKTVTLRTEDGFGNPSVMDSSGNVIPVSGKGNKWTFKMPASDVRVSAKTYGLCAKDKACLLAGYTDLMTSAWYHDGIHFCLAQGLMRGISGQRFEPEGTLTRGMLVTILWRYAGSPTEYYPISFRDVNKDGWYGTAIRWAASKGIVFGYSTESFGPDDPITREQLALILYRYAVLSGADFTVAKSYALPFSDRDQISAWAADAVTWCYQAGIMNGKANGTLVPCSRATRAEAAAMVQRFCEHLERSGKLS